MPHMISGARVLAAPLVLALLGGCTGVLPTPPGSPPGTYLLAPGLPSSGHRPPALGGSGPTLLVSRPEAAAGYTSPRMAYLEQEYRLDYFADHEWVDSPAAMLGPLLVSALRWAGDGGRGQGAAFGAVSEDARGIAADLRLDTLIESLYQDFRVSPSRVRVALRVRLLDPNRGRILATQVFDDTEPAPSDDPYGGVVALNRVLARLLPLIAEFAAESALRLEQTAPAPEP